MRLHERTRVTFPLLALTTLSCDRSPVPAPLSGPNNVLTQKVGLSGTQQVLLISIDGLHAVDLERFIAGHPASTLARLAHMGTRYTEASASKPSDSYPGLLAIVTGGSPRSTGVYYDDSYDRRLSPPGSNCSTRGTEVVYDESIDLN